MNSPRVLLPTISCSETINESEKFGNDDDNDNGNGDDGLY